MESHLIHFKTNPSSQIHKTQFESQPPIWAVKVVLPEISKAININKTILGLVYTLWCCLKYQNINRGRIPLVRHPYPKQIAAYTSVPLKNHPVFERCEELTWPWGRCFENIIANINNRMCFFMISKDFTSNFLNV